MGFFPDRIQRPGAAPTAPPPGAPTVARPAPASAAPARGPIEDAAEDAARRVARFEAEAPRFDLDDVVLAEDTRRRIVALIAKIDHHHTLYEEWGLAAVDPGGRRVALNLFGPPGTGKTMCAEAIARRLRKRIVTVSYAELESKYVGETPKNIVAAFAAARQQDAVLFFDEADSILGRRLTSVTQSADHGVNVSRSVMLLQLDRFEGVVVFATNLAKNYDGAFVRRILGHVELPLPDADGRARLARRLLTAKLPRAADVDEAWLASRTEGLSGGELLQLVIGAATRAVQREGDARQVERADLDAEVEAFRAARRAVGAEPAPARVEERVLSDDESAAWLAAARPDAGPQAGARQSAEAPDASGEPTATDARAATPDALAATPDALTGPAGAATPDALAGPAGAETPGAPDGPG